LEKIPALVQIFCDRKTTFNGHDRKLSLVPVSDKPKSKKQIGGSVPAREHRSPLWWGERPGEPARQ
jgi:hypothetical protein